ncbi:MAG TPA: helix-turn-helix domain-containing protein [Gryllotalpicola sp.]
MTSTAGEEGASSEIQAVTRVGQIFSLFGAQCTELTATEVAERLGLNRTTAYRYCASLAAVGFLERGSRRGSFMLGGLMLELGILAIGRRRVVELAPSYLGRLSSATRTTAVMSLWGATGPVVTRVEEDMQRTVVVTVRVGARLDHRTAQAKVFLAWHPDRYTVERMIGDLDPVERAELELELDQVRETGISIVSETDGLVGAAAPVFDEYGICATVALLGTDRMTDFTPDSDAMRLLIDVADALTSEVRGSTPPHAAASVPA